MFAQLVKWFQPSHAYGITISYYAQIVSQARQPFFYTHRGVADSVDGRFDLILLHLHILLAGHDYEMSLKKQMMELVVADLDKSLREMGIGDMTIGKKVDKAAFAMNGRLQAYEAAGNDKTTLAEAISRNLYRSEETAEHAHAMAEYTLQAAALLGGQDDEAELVWPKLG